MMETHLEQYTKYKQMLAVMRRRLDEMSDSLGDAPKAVKDSYFDLYRTVAELNGRLNALKMGLLKETDHREEEDQTNPFHAKEFICDACGQPLIGKISEVIDAAGVQIGD